ncbi:gamma carbonic anhydrase family protein [Alkaliphilus crotonatoxidans]
MIKAFKGINPEIHETCFIAETADIIGRVTLGKNSNIWYNAVLRGDDNDIIVGENTNIQDNCVVHISHIHPTVIGNNVTIGHGAIVHACKVEDNCLIGMGAIILNGAEIGAETIIGAGSLVPSNKKIPSGVLAMGSPAKVIRPLTEEEKKELRTSADDYVALARTFKDQ